MNFELRQGCETDERRLLPDEASPRRQQLGGFKDEGYISFFYRLARILVNRITGICRCRAGDQLSTEHH
ncbi:hypothetical protein [Candidatus Regiella endosymbiont of Tuberolachnus salignus]|uniref:hypothetical protein n=1 Tax=Candidatus Regiella endosymbiont of Tuberolachnus salignus TaxID=3077956 RepID=UPI0030D3B800